MTGVGRYLAGYAVLVIGVILPLTLAFYKKGRPAMYVNARSHGP